ncbi:MAG: glutamine amidotransferase [Peptococcaceae bacterium]|nr:glutamine amidotransferase [Peptococcaceae bacterium]
MHREFKGTFKICHLYPDLLNLYGDQGNVAAITRRCQWRGIETELHFVNIGDMVDFSEMDFVFLGGGSDREQNLMAADLAEKKDSLWKAIEDNLPILAICGGYQLLGKYYQTIEGKIIPGLDLLDFHTIGGEKRLIGNIAVEIQLGGESHKITGFENHSGCTFLGDIEPLGIVLSGYGNNGKDQREGAQYKNVIASYLHGPLLPKNPLITDYLISRALERRGHPWNLKPLDDSLENAANEFMLGRMLG